MPNPTYGATYDATIPTPFVQGITNWGNGYANSSVGTALTVPTAGAELRFGIGGGNSSLGSRIAYQVRRRYSANAVGWDGGETWTDWMDAGGNVDEWEELYTTSFTALSSLSTVYGFSRADMRSVTSDFKPSVAWSTVATYDAVEYRVQAWQVKGSGNSVRYGSPDVKVIRVNFAPTFSVSAKGNSADDSLSLALSISGWARGARYYAVKSLTFSPTGGDVTIARSVSSVDGTFAFPASAVGEYVKTSPTVKVRGIAYPNGSSASFSYDVSASIAAWAPDGSKVTAPSTTVADAGSAKVFSIANATYDRVEIAVSWDGGGYEVVPRLEGGIWSATVCPPYNVEAAWVVTAYDTIGGTEYYNKSNGTFTVNGWGYTLTADDGREVTLALEAKEQRSTDEDATVTTLASGRQIARHGYGTKRTFSLRGQLLGASHSATSDWLDALAILDEPANLTYRNPYGEVIRVAVTSWTRSPASVWDVVDVSINFAEVE